MTAGVTSFDGTGSAPRPVVTASRPEQWLRGGVVLLVVTALAVAALLRPVEPGSGGALTIAGQPIPEVCSLKRTTGLPCPGCGLTRSWVAVLDGEGATSLAHHPLGWLVLLYALAQGARHAVWLALPRRRAAVERVGSRLDRGVLLLGALLVVAWLPRILVLLHDRL